MFVRPRLKAVRGDHDHRDPCKIRVRFDLAQNFCAVDVRKREVERDQIRSKLARQPHCLAAVFRHDYAAAAVLEEDPQNRGYGGIVLDDENRALAFLQCAGLLYLSSRGGELVQGLDAV